jgi:hypothetical protein
MAAVVAVTIGVGLNLSVASVEARGTTGRDLSAACSYLAGIINDPSQPALIVQLATLAFSALGC